MELFFNFDKFENNIYLKHLLCFLIFIISGICFTLFLIKRFSNLYVTIFGTLSYCLSPKIYGASFFDGKDLFFLSLFSITIYFYQKYELKKKYKLLIIFALFTAFLTSSRLIGLMIFTSFISIYLIKILSKDELNKNLKILFIYIISFLILLYLHWPFLWDLLSFKVFDFVENKNITFFFNGDFYKQDNIPLIFIPNIILISTPIFISIFFLIGLFLILKKFYLNLISIDEKINKKTDFWINKNEEIDFLILLCLFQTIIIYLIFNDRFTASWRHFFFFHFFLIFYFSYFLNFIFIKLKEKKNKIFLIIFLVLLNFEMISKLYIYHPYQYNYFNNLLTKKQKLLYERDTAHLSRFDALSDILNDGSSLDLIKIGNASASPLNDTLFMFSNSQIKKIKLIGNDDLQNSDYIYTNYIYEVNIKYNNKYQIPKNFMLYKSVIKNDTLIYSIYKKK